MGSWRIDFYLPGKAEYRDKVGEASDEAVWVCTGFQRMGGLVAGFRSHASEDAWLGELISPRAW